MNHVRWAESGGRAPEIITQDKIGDQSGSAIEPAEFSGAAAIGKEIVNSGAFKARARASNLLVWALCCFKVDLDGMGKGEYCPCNCKQATGEVELFLVTVLKGVCCNDVLQL